MEQESKIKKPKIEVKRIDSFQEGDQLFTSNGISRVKVTKEGEVKCIEVPIQSTGISELLDLAERSAPQPPTQDVLAHPGEPLADELGITKKTWVKVIDTADPTYIEAKKDHDSHFGMKILMQGLAIEVKDTKGNMVKDIDKKIDILKSMGMSGEQFTKIIADITSLTKWNEGEEAELFA